MHDRPTTSREFPGLDGHLREAAILTRAVENVLRKLIRLLIGRISLTRLQELIRLIFVQEAEAFVKREKPGKNVPMTKLALLTGLDTRTLGKVMEETATGTPVHESKNFLREITPECSVLDFWQVNSRYLDDDGQPLELPIKGDVPSFESLISETLTSRGVTENSLLERLRTSKAVEITSDGKAIRMLDRRFWPFQQKDDSATLEIGLISVGNLIDTVSYNLFAQKNGEEPHFQRSTWTHRLSSSQQASLRATIRKLLTDSEVQVTEILGRFEDEEIEQDQITVGVGIYYFEEPIDNP